MRTDSSSRASRRPERAGRARALLSLTTKARAQLEKAAYEALHGSMSLLSERLRDPSARAQGAAHRMRDVLHGDRALAAQLESMKSAAQKLTPPQPPARPPAPKEDPIRTRTMARLLALQGYRERAISIYGELLARNPEDRTLAEELARLSAQGRSESAVGEDNATAATTAG